MGTGTWDGGVIPSGINVKNSSSDDHNLFGVYKGQVRAVVFPEDEDSESKSRMEYTVRVNGQDYYNVVDIRSMGGQFNYSERILDEVEHSESGEVDDSAYEEVINGEVVWIMLTEGDTDFPIIIGSGSHPRNRTYRQPKREDGKQNIDEFNGIEFKIDKDSNYTITHVGRKKPEHTVEEEAFENEEAIGTNTKFYGNGDYEINIVPLLDKEGEEKPDDEVYLKFTKETKKYELKVQKNKFVIDETGILLEDKFENKIQMGETEILLNAIKDLVANVEAKMTITSKQDVSINSDAKVEVIGAGGVDVKSDGSVKIEGTGSTDVGSGASVTNVNGSMVMLAGGGAPIARLGDMAVGTGNMGGPVISNIVQGSSKVFSP